MSKLPQVNVRLAPEHHDLIREMAQRLRSDPSLAVGLAEFLAQTGSGDQPQVSPLTHGLADEVAALMERLAALEEREPRMTKIAALEARMAALEQRMDGIGRTAAAPQTSSATGQPLVAGGQGSRRRLTDHGVAEVGRMIRAGVGDAEIAGLVGMDRGAIRQRRKKLEETT
jgi:hypothetical protein